MKKIAFLSLMLLTGIIIFSSCKKDSITPVPDVIMTKDDTLFELSDTVLVLPGIELHEGLTGEWEVIESNDIFTLSDPLDPKCKFIGRPLGVYKLRWTVKSGDEEKFVDIVIKMFAPIPDIILSGNVIDFKVYNTTLVLNGIDLKEGLCGRWEVLKNTDIYALSDSLNPQCQFSGALLGGYKLRWTVSNSKDEKYKDITISVIGVTDSRDSINYRVVKLGNQVWFAENLKTTKYQNGDLIGTTSPVTLNVDLEETPKYQWAVNGDENNVALYGRLYTGFAVTDDRQLCPSGWHMPDSEEWTLLTDYLTNNAFGYEGSGDDIAKALAATTSWLGGGSPGDPGNDVVNNNTSGFNAYPAGDRLSNGLFENMGSQTQWWSSTADTFGNLTLLFMSNSYSSTLKTASWRGTAFSVRCLKD